MSEEIEERLSRRFVPGGPRTWLDVFSEAALAEGAALEDVLRGWRTRMAVRARHRAWMVLRELGYSYPEIGNVCGVDHSAVMLGVRTAKARLVVTPKEAAVFARDVIAAIDATTAGEAPAPQRRSA